MFTHFQNIYATKSKAIQNYNMYKEYDRLTCGKYKCASVKSRIFLIQTIPFNVLKYYNKLSQT